MTRGPGILFAAVSQRRAPVLPFIAANGEARLLRKLSTRSRKRFMSCPAHGLWPSVFATHGGRQRRHARELFPGKIDSGYLGRSVSTARFFVRALHGFSESTALQATNLDCRARRAAFIAGAIALRFFLHLPDGRWPAMLMRKISDDCTDRRAAFDLGTTAVRIFPFAFFTDERNGRGKTARPSRPRRGFVPNATAARCAP